MKPNAWIPGLLALLVIASPLAAAGGGGMTPASGPDAFASPMLSQGQSFTANFTVAGVHTYHCHPHPTMKGRVVVTPLAAEGNRTVEIQAFHFVPEEVEVRPNASVTWTNLDSTPHTATMDEEMAGHHHGTPAPDVVLVLSFIGAAVAAARRRSG